MRDFAMSTCGISKCGEKWRIFLAVMLACLVSPALRATARPDDREATPPPGIAWDVQGLWRAEGREIMTGDAVRAGALLQPGERGEPSHSITILLPDGQRILYECFTAKDCARGFRIPVLQRDPSRFAAAMMERIHAALMQERRNAAISDKGQHIARDEAAVVPGPQNRIEVGGLAEALSNGRYSGDLRSFDSRYPERSGIPLEKSGPSIALTVPGPGLYVLRIVDSMKRPRIEFMIGVAPAQSTRIVKEFQEAQELIEEWNGNYQGWPIHDLQRAYLESLMLGIRPTSGSEQETADKDQPLTGVTAEPTFTPRPSILSGDSAVTLRCATPGAVIHYTVDESQPFENSPVYHAPIMVKGTGLAIKAFARAPGKKDSAVVTGIFRIQGQKD